MGARASAVLTATLLLLSTGCASDGGGTSVPPDTQSSSASGQEVPASEGSTDGAPATEDPDGIEPPATGRSSVAIKLGGGSGTGQGIPRLVPGTWCALALWDGLSAPGVQLEIRSVSLVGDQAQLLGGGCSQAPPCEGAVISAVGQRCALLLDAAAVSDVEFQVSGELTCPDQATCDALEAGSALQPAELSAERLAVPTGPTDFGVPEHGAPGGGVVDGDAGGGTSGSGSPSPAA